MPIVETKRGYGYTYKRENEKRKKLPPIYKLLLIFVLLIAIVFGGIFLSTKISSFLGIGPSMLFNKKNLYAIKIASFNSYEDAFTFSGTIKNQGGAGYIIVKDNQYNVLLSCYEEKNDAEKVCGNLKQNNVDCEIFNIFLEKINKKLDFDAKNTKILKKNINLFYESYKTLYDLSINYDNKTFSKMEVLEELNRLIEKNNEQIKGGKILFSGNNASLVYLKIYLTELQENLQKLKLVEQNFSAEIKNTYFRCLNLYMSFRQEIQK